jgi:hypothetical protein
VPVGVGNGINRFSIIIMTLGKFVRGAFAPHSLYAVSRNGSVEAIAGWSDLLDDPSDNGYQKDTKQLSKCLCDPSSVEDPPVK